MELFGARPRRSPLEKQHPGGPPSDRLVAHGPHLPRYFGRVVRPPIDSLAGLFHDHPRYFLVDRTDEVVVHGTLHGPLGVGWVRVIVRRGHVEVGSPTE